MPSLSTMVLRAQTYPDHHEPGDIDDFGIGEVAATAAVTLAAIRSACQMKHEGLRSQRFVVRGSGSRGLGVARIIRRALMELGMTWKDAAASILVLDAEGLLLEGRDCEEHKRPFATSTHAVEGWSFKGEAPNLRETIAQSGATVLIGLSGHPGIFDATVVKAMCANSDRPVILPLSMPLDRAETNPEDILVASKGAAITAAAVDGPHGPGVGEMRAMAGLGFGALIAGALRIDEDMVLAAAGAMHRHSHAIGDGALVPHTEHMRDVTLEIATEVARAALRSGAATNEDLTFAGLGDYVAARFDEAGATPEPAGAHWKNRS